MKTALIRSTNSPAAKAPKRRILVSLLSWYYFRQLAPVLEILAQEGHRLHIVAQKQDRGDFEQGVLELESRYPRVSHEIGPPRDDGWQDTAMILRQLLGYVQYLDLHGEDQAHTRLRYEKATGQTIPAALGEDGWLRGKAGRIVARRVLDRLDRALPLDPAIEALFDRVRPDLLLITPLLDDAGEQRNYMKSARARGVPSVFPVHSWDNLSSKARILDRPDRILVWNETQREEAVRYHAVSRRRVTVTGAQGFDEWFERRPSVDRAQFCAAAGLDPDKPIILYVCSAILARHVSEACADRTEIPYVKRWLSELRSFPDPILRDCGVIIRPHPKRHDMWEDVDLGDERVAVWPRLGELPAYSASKALFFDSLYHSGAVMGLNTSAMIEAGIVGRPAFTYLDPDYRGGQSDMPHFQYLLEVGGGLLFAEDDMQRHLTELAAALRHPDRYRAKARSFTEAFVRPLGLGRAAAPVFARIVLDAAESGGRVRKPSALDPLLRRALKIWEIAPRLKEQARKEALATQRSEEKTALESARKLKTQHLQEKAHEKRQLLQEKALEKRRIRLEKKALKDALKREHAREREAQDEALDEGEGVARKS